MSYDLELIEQVQKFTFLFDKSNVDFKNRTKRKNAWETIAVICNDTADNVEKRWGMLRNRYALEKRKIRCIPSGSAAGGAPWRYYSYLQFLDGYVKARKTVGNYQASMDQTGEAGDGEPSEPSSQLWDSLSIITDLDENNQNVVNIESPVEKTLQIVCAPTPKLVDDKKPAEKTPARIRYSNSQVAGPSSATPSLTPSKTPTSHKTKGKKNKTEEFQDMVNPYFVRVEQLLTANESSSDDEDELFAKSLIKTLKRQKKRKTKAQIKVRFWQILAEYDGSDSSDN